MSSTHKVFVGTVPIGGGAPVSVQSMCTTKTTDASATLEQIRELADAGCEIIRVAVPDADALDGFEQICASSPLPVVADIHFDHKLAIGAAKRGAQALRINPGNIGSNERVKAVIEAASAANIPIRIGVNAGSLDPKVAQMSELSLPEKLVLSCESFVRFFEEQGFTNIVLSAKAHSVPVTIQTYRMLANKLAECPLHVGVTEAGTLRQGTVKNCVGVGVLLNEGIGDTMRLSLTADPIEEVHIAWELLAALGMRRLHPELVSCPTCGRTQVDLIGMAQEVEKRLQHIQVPISVAVMGCVVNGPGEARDADLGIACGRGKGVVFAHGEALRTVDEDQLVDELFAEIEERFVRKDAN